MLNNVDHKNPMDDWIHNKIGFNTGSLSRQVLMDYQLNKLRETIHYVSKNSPFYRKHLKKFADVGLNSLDDLAQFPFTTPQDIREHGLQMLCVSQSEIERVVTLDSSGTTGASKRVYFTQDEQELTVDYFLQGMSTLTVPGERVMILLPGERSGSIGDLLYTALVRLGAQPIKHGIITSLSETQNKIAETRADVLVGIPNQVLALARYDERKGRTNPIFLKRILLSTDYVPQTTIHEIQRIWGCEVFRYYGMTEMGLGGGIECSYHNGFHFYEGDFFVEVVAPDTGELLPEGQYGELVISTLTRRGMPLLRYRTGDLSRFISNPCPCGSVLRRIDNIRARKSGVIRIDQDYNLTIADLDEVLLGIPGITDFSASVSSQPGRISLDIRLVTTGQMIDMEAVRYELYRFEALQLAEKKGKLDISLEIKKSDDAYVPHASKRSIKQLG